MSRNFPTGSGQNAQQAADDPTYHPTGSGKRKAPPKPKPYAWIYPPSDGVDTPELIQKLNDVLNFVSYCCTETFVPITTPDSARYALLKTDFRARLYYVTPHHNKMHFGEMVRQGLRYDGWKTIAPYYTYLGENAYTPTEMEHTANLAKLGTATQSPPEPPIPVRPIMPPDPGKAPAKPVGVIHPIKHPFTKQDLDNYAARNPDNPIAQQVMRLYNIPSSHSIAAQMYLAADFCCHMITPLTPKDSLRTWVRRVIAELRWRDIKVGYHRDSGNYQDTRQVFEWAKDNKIMVFTGLDDGPLHTDIVSASAMRTYVDLKRKWDADVIAYNQALKDLQAWTRKYGNRVPPKPAEDETFQILTPVGEEHLAKKRRVAELLANAVCLDCKDPNCTCKQLPSQNATAKTDVPPTAITTREVKVKTE